MSSRWGEQFCISIFGESHGASIGVVIDGLPSGIPLDLAEISQFMQRRAPGRNKTSTARQESDLPQIQSGFHNGVTTGTPLCAVIANSDTHSSDYAPFSAIARPGHADYTGAVRYGGHQDVRGGGHFSGRLTAPLCFAGAVAKQLLKQKGILVGAHIAQIAGVSDLAFDPVSLDADTLLCAGQRDFPVLDVQAGETMREKIEAARMAQDSVGGVVECAAIGLPAGIGSPMFGGLENRIASIVFGIPAVKGLEFGAGFAVAQRYGSENNDDYCLQNGQIRTATNNAGAI